MNRVFQDRREGGRALAELLVGREDFQDPVVLALPRGGVPVGAEVARALGAPMDILVVRKLGLPGQPELAMGAVASGGVVVRNPEVLRQVGVDDAAFRSVAARETRELLRREAAYRGERTPVEIRGRTVLLVDDGIATGSTVRAAIQALRLRGAERVVVAVPVVPPDVRDALTTESDEVVCVSTPRPFHAISPWYREFPQLSDDEVRDILDAPNGGPSTSSTAF
jgi:putative phosphoribosyl transferase